MGVKHNKVKGLENIYTSLNGEVLEYKCLEITKNHLVVSDPRERSVHNFRLEDFEKFYFGTPVDCAKAARDALEKYVTRCIAESELYGKIIAANGEGYASPKKARKVGSSWFNPFS